MLAAVSACKLVAPVAVKATTFVVPALAVSDGVVMLAALSACKLVAPTETVNPDEEVSPTALRAALDVKPATFVVPVEVSDAVDTLVAVSPCKLVDPVDTESPAAPTTPKPPKT